MSEPITELFKELRDETTLLLKEEVALAKTEMQEKASVYTKSTASIGIGALVAFAGIVLLLVGFGFLLTGAFISGGLSYAMSHFLGMGIVGLLVAAAGGIACSVAIKKIKDEPLVPEKTIQSLKESKQWAKTQTA